MTITAAELIQMRADVQELMPDTCNLLTATGTADGYGGVTMTWGTATSGVSCRLDNASNTTYGEKLVANGIQPFSRWILSVPYGSAMTDEMRVEIGADIYNVTMVDVDKSWPIVERAVLEAV